MSQTFTDKYGDTLQIGQDNPGRVYVSVTETDDEAEVSFSVAEAVEVADAILKAAGRRQRPDTVINQTVVTAATTDGDTTKDPREAWNETALQAALDHEHIAEFSYAKADGGIIETRRLQPYSRSQTRQGNTLFYGFDPDRNDDRAYRLDRIVGYVVVR